MGIEGSPRSEEEASMPREPVMFDYALYNRGDTPTPTAGPSRSSEAVPQPRPPRDTSDGVSEARREETSAVLRSADTDAAIKEALDGVAQTHYEDRLARGLAADAEAGAAQATVNAAHNDEVRAATGRPDASDPLAGHSQATRDEIARIQAKNRAREAEIATQQASEGSLPTPRTPWPEDQRIQTPGEARAAAEQLRQDRDRDHQPS